MQRRLFVFDYWIRNEDRTATEHGGNPNLFLSGPNYEPVVIDHNLAFDPAFSLENNRLYHVCREAWRTAQGDLLLPAQMRDMMVDLASRIDRAAMALPEEWLEMAPNAAKEMVAWLRACDTDEFWEALNG